jgi:hypothetical protein
MSRGLGNLAYLHRREKVIKIRSPIRAIVLPDRGRATAPGDPVGAQVRVAVEPRAIAATLIIWLMRVE